MNDRKHTCCLINYECIYCMARYMHRARTHHARITREIFPATVQGVIGKMPPLSPQVR